MEERIERYVDAELTEAEKQQFEADLAQDAALADDLAFYLQSKVAAQQAAHEALLAEKHKQWNTLEAEPPRSLTRSAWMSMAASVLLVVAILFYFNNPFKQSLNDRAETYLATHFKTLPVHLGDESQSLQGAIQAYNQQQYEPAITLAAIYLSQHPQDAEALRVIGLAHLQKKEYHEALAYFQQLSAQTQLYSNPGKYYEGLTYLLRNQEGDEAQGRKLLEEVIAQNLEGKPEAMELLEQ